MLQVVILCIVTVVRKFLDHQSGVSGDVNGSVDAVVVGSNPPDLQIGALGSEDEPEAQDGQSCHRHGVNHLVRIGKTDTKRRFKNDNRHKTTKRLRIRFPGNDKAF